MTSLLTVLSEALAATARVEYPNLFGILVGGLGLANILTDDAGRCTWVLDA